MWKDYGKVRTFCEALDVVDLPEDGVNCFFKSVVDKVYVKHLKTTTTNWKSELPPDPSYDRLIEIRTNQEEPAAPTDDDVWIFGYGSLMWKADFAFIDRRRGYICGYKRRFYQNSIDHRGTPEKPGRVVTLLPTDDATDRVYGVAYRIAACQIAEVLPHLDFREKNGYERRELKFQEFPEEAGESFTIITYIATPENESYAGDVWQVPRIAIQIYTSAGPSGRNRDYVIHLGWAMRELFPGVRDEHLHEIENELLRRIQVDEVNYLEMAIETKICKLLADVDTTEIAIEEAVERFESLKEACAESGWKEALLSSMVAHCS